MSAQKWGKFGEDFDPSTVALGKNFWFLEEYSPLYSAYYCSRDIYLEWILSFKMKFIWSKSTTHFEERYDYLVTLKFSLVWSYVFYYRENQSKIIDMYISMEKSDQA